MKHTVDFFFDFLSPYAYYARHRLVQIARETGVEIAYRPVDLQRLKKAAANTGPATVQMPRKLAYALRDFERWGARYRIPAAVSPACFDVREMHLGMFHAAAQGRAEAYVKAGFERMWGQGGAKQDAQHVFVAVAEAAGLHMGALRQAVESAEAAEALELTFEDAVSKGAFGVPSFWIDGELWWGNDRLFMLEEHLRSAKQPQREVA